MSSRTFRRCTGRLLAAGIFLLTLEACGRKGDPQPPPQKHPARTIDLTVEQNGSELVLTMSYPTMTVGGLALPSIDRLELIQYTRPAPEFMPQPEAELIDTEATAAEPTAEPSDDNPPSEETPAAESPTESATTEPTVAEEVAAEDILPADQAVDSEAGTEGDPSEDAEGLQEPIPEEPPNPYLNIRLDSKEFDKQAETVLVLEGTDLEAALVGGRIVMRLPLVEIATEPPVAYTFAVRTFAGRLRSPWSKTASFVPLPAPSAPADLTTEIDARGVRLSWSVLDDESGIEGYRVLRRPAQSVSFAEPLATVEPGVSEYFDASARFGNGYVYAVSAVRMEKPLVESTFSDEQEVDYRDTFAPRAPQGLVLLAEADRIRLLWDTGREPDISGYLVFVSVGDGDPQQLTPEPIDASEFVHEGTVSGTTYVYTVLAVDEAGNRSESSSPVTTRAP